LARILKLIAWSAVITFIVYIFKKKFGPKPVPTPLPSPIPRPNHLPNHLPVAPVTDVNAVEEIEKIL